jgi:hypothetical protein
MPKLDQHQARSWEIEESAQRFAQRQSDQRPAQSSPEQEFLAASQQPLQTRLVTLRAEMSDIVSHGHAEHLQRQAEEIDEIQGRVAVAKLAGIHRQAARDNRTASKVAQPNDKAEGRPNDAATP